MPIALFPELSFSNLVRLAAECDELRRRSIDLCARSRAVVATAEIAVPRGRAARAIARGRLIKWYASPPAA